MAMAQVFVSDPASDAIIDLLGRTYPFTLIGSVTGLGALADINATGEVHDLRDTILQRLVREQVQAYYFVVRNGRPMAQEQPRRRHATDRRGKRPDPHHGAEHDNPTRGNGAAAPTRYRSGLLFAARLRSGQCPKPSGASR
jgi:hypothetical protein